MSHRIIVDVMGADNGSGVVIRGAVAGARRAGASLLLVGSRAVIENELADVKTKGLDIQIEHADTVVQMDDQPGVVMKEKSDSSMALAVRLLKEGRGVLCAPLSVLGDLFASIIKRQSGVKDFGHIMPGHGGIMDRFDSMMFVLPVLYILVQYVPLVYPL